MIASKHSPASVEDGRRIGEVTERLKVHDWKSCVRLTPHRGFESLLSAIKPDLIEHSDFSNDRKRVDINSVGSVTMGGSSWLSARCAHVNTKGSSSGRNPLDALDAYTGAWSALAMPPRFLVRGGRPLRGTVRPAGNKNAALPILAATLLADGPVRARERPAHPRRRDDARAAGRSRRQRRVDRRPTRSRVDTRGASSPSRSIPALCARIRASILLAGPLLARFGQVDAAAARGRRDRPAPGGHPLPRPGAARRLVMVGDRYELEAKAPHRQPTSSSTSPASPAPRTRSMAAVAAKGRTVLRNAACEPHVQDLARCLVAMGAQIEGIGTNIYTIEGGRPLHGARYAIGPDHIEIGSFIGLAAVTNGEITIEPVPARRPAQHAAGLRAARHPAASRRAPAHRGRRPGAADPPRPRRARAQARGRPLAGVPGRLMSTAIVTATQCAGMLLVFEKMFESRLFFVDKLIGMGARIVLCDPHRAVISGPVAAQGRHGRVARHPRRHGDAARGARGRRREHHPQRRTDRAGLRADRRAAARPGRRDRARGWIAARPRTPAARAGAAGRLELGSTGVREARRWWRASPVAAREPGQGFDLGLWSRGAGRRDDAPLAAPFAQAMPSSTALLGHQVHGVEVREPRARRAAGSRSKASTAGSPTTPRTCCSPSPWPTAFRCISRTRRGAVALLHAGWRGTAGGILERGVERLPRVAVRGPSDIAMHCGVGICGRCYEVGSEVMQGCGSPADGPGPWHLDLARSLGRQAPGSGSRTITRVHWCTRPRQRPLLHPPGVGGKDGRMVAFLGAAPSADAHRRQLDLGRGEASFTSLSRGRLYGPTARCGGGSPTFFFSRCQMSCRRAPRSRFAITWPGSASSSSICGEAGPWNARSCRFGSTARTADRPGSHGRRLRAAQPGPRAIPGSQGAGRAALCARGVVARLERPLRWPEHWRRFVGRRVRVRAEALGGPAGS